MSTNQDIPKVAENSSNFIRPYYLYSNARTAWEEILLHYKNKSPNLTVIIPSYIGYSVNEGSGIFDPIDKLSVPFKFYALNKKLQVDLDNLKQTINKIEGDKLVLLVHYFGFIDSQYQGICDWLDNNNIIYAEDCAHAMLTDVIGGICGRRGSHSFYSLHKLMPFKEGGILVNNGRDNDIKPKLSYPFKKNVYHYDLKSIFDKRQSNFMYLTSLLKDLKGIELFKKELLEGECPQTLPVFIIRANRDAIYFEMNKNGFGLVSLYHTMIDELQDKNYESSSITSKILINFPIHQDVTQSQLYDMVEIFKKLINHSK